LRALGRYIKYMVSTLGVGPPLNRELVAASSCGGGVRQVVIHFGDVWIAGTLGMLMDAAAAGIYFFNELECDRIEIKSSSAVCMEKW
jgi:hypothetical protein